MSKLVLIKNLKKITNKGKPTEQIVHFDVCSELMSCQLFRDLDLIRDEVDYDVNLYFKTQAVVATFDKFDDARRLMEDLVHTLQNKDHHFVELDLLNYETK